MGSLFIAVVLIVLVAEIAVVVVLHVRAIAIGAARSLERLLLEAHAGQRHVGHVSKLRKDLGRCHVRARLHICRSAIMTSVTR